MNSREITLWIDERWYKALEQHLPGGSVEDALNDHLDRLVNQLPENVYDRISREIHQEKLQARAEQEAARRFAVFHIKENGAEQYVQVERRLEFLDAARLLRAYLRGERGADSFRQMLHAPQEISAGDFRQMAHLRMENTGKVTGAFELDFDRQRFSALHIMDGWKVFSMKDVSTAAYHADRKGRLPSEQRWERFLDALDGKELTHESLSMPLSGSRRLLPEEISFEDEVSEMDTRLNFYVPVHFDPDEVFGIHVSASENDDYVNVYANYDLESGEVCGALDVVLWHGESATEYKYPLASEETEALLKKMDAYCIETAGKTLSEWREEYLAEQQEQELQMGGMG